MAWVELTLFLRATRMNHTGCAQYCQSYSTPLPQTHVRNYYYFYYQICTGCNSINPHCSDKLFSSVCSECYQKYERTANDVNRADAFNWTTQKLPWDYYKVLLEVLIEHYNYYGGYYE